MPFAICPALFLPLSITKGLSNIVLSHPYLYPDPLCSKPFSDDSTKMGNQDFYRQKTRGTSGLHTVISRDPSAAH